MDLSVFGPILAFHSRMLRTLPTATAPQVLRAPLGEGKVRPTPGADLFDRFASEAVAVRAQVEQALAAGAGDDQQAMQQIVAAASAPLPPIDLALAAQLQASATAQAAPAPAPPAAPPASAPAPQPKKRATRPPKG